MNFKNFFTAFFMIYSETCRVIKIIFLHLRELESTNDIEILNRCLFQGLQKCASPENRKIGFWFVRFWSKFKYASNPAYLIDFDVLITFNHTEIQTVTPLRWLHHQCPIMLRARCNCLLNLNLPTLFYCGYVSFLRSNLVLTL